MIKELSNRIIAVQGSIFSDRLNVDGIGLFVPCGLTGFRFQADAFVREKADSELIIVYEPNEAQHIWTPSEARKMIKASLDTLYSHNAKRVAFNGIRTTLGSIGSEEVEYDAVVDWLEMNPEAEMTIYLVDLRGGFNKMIP